MIRLHWPARYALRSFRLRLLLWFLSLLLGMQAAIFTGVYLVSSRNARQAVDEALDLTASTLQNSLETRRKSLLEKARLLSADHSFREVFADNDHATLISALDNYRNRVRADWMLMVDLDGNWLANTLQPELMTGTSSTTFPYQEMLRQAEESDELNAAAIVFADDSAYQLVLVPLRAPATVAWVGIGFAITDAFARELEQQTRSHVSLLKNPLAVTQAAPNPTDQLLASTLTPRQRIDLLKHLNVITQNGTDAPMIALENEEFVSRTLNLHSDSQLRVDALLQRSLDQALSGFFRLRNYLIGLFLVSGLLAAWGAIRIAADVTKPVTQLARGARRISAGNYEELPKPIHQDEIGTLTTAYNEMVRGLLERDKVRALLGKVVSPAVAEELLNRRIELGGEERELTLLFSDIRDFTVLCEQRPPAQVLALLNTYLTQMSAQVDAYQGVVDKYIGDAVMALFGAPISGTRDARNAVLSALAMQAAMPALNKQFAQAQWPPLTIGIGIHTGRAVAGNMGSETRLNYTVIGDSVNLASRLESLCKHYGIGIIVSDATRTACLVDERGVTNTPTLCFREFDRVQVKGKQDVVTLYQPLTPNSVDSEWLEQWQQALHRYRERQWSAAQALFAEVQQRLGADDALCALYLARCQANQQQEPDADWDAITRFDHK